MRITNDLRVRLLDLPALVELKASTGRTRDRLSVPVLVTLLAARDGGVEGGGSG